MIAMTISAYTVSIVTLAACSLVGGNIFRIGFVYATSRRVSAGAAAEDGGTLGVLWNSAGFAVTAHILSTPEPFPW